MLRLLPGIIKTLSKPRHLHIPRRFFLSDSFNLQNAWDARLSSPIIKKINATDMFYELDNQFQHYANASALDIDLFVNTVDDDSNFDEVEDVVHKFRLSPEAINILPSTHHAFIRLYMKCKRTKDLIRILDDRLNYGIFPDHFCTIMMMDSFIKEGNFRDAAKVGTFCMLQEDLSSPLINYMSLYSCHKYLENQVPWMENESEELEEDDDEEIKVRVKYIRNPYFDDHFDLVDPKHLIGKTFHFIGGNIDDHVGRTYKLIGLILHGKLDKAIAYLKNVSSQADKGFVRDGLNIAKSLLNEQSNDENKTQFLANEVQILKTSLDSLISDTQVNSEKNLLTIVEEKLKVLVQENESLIIKEQLENYKNWELTREKLLMEQLAKIHREEQLSEIERQKQLLQAKEEEIFFFDNEDKIDLIIEEKQQRKEEQIERERKRLEPFLPKKKEIRITTKKVPVNPPLDGFIDDNIPMNLIKTKL